MLLSARTESNQRCAGAAFDECLRAAGAHWSRPPAIFGSFHRWKEHFALSRPAGRHPQKQSGALHKVLCPAFFQESGGVEKSVENVHLSHFIPFSLTKNMLYCSLRFTCILHFLWEGSSWPISIVSSASPKGATPDTWFGTICGSLWGSPPWACCWAG